jgi:hypothetical protein
MIFGLQNSKFVSGSTTVDLAYTNLDPLFIIPDLIEHVSPFTGIRHYLLKNTYAEFSITVHLWKYANPKAKYLEIMSYLNESVTFYPHKDGEPIRNLYNENVPCVLYSIEEYYLNDTNFYDVLKLNFKATEDVSYNNTTEILGYGYGYGTYYGGQL